MPTRKTSVTVYRQIEAEGLLSKLRFQVYEILFHNGPMTANEVVAYGKTKFKSTRPRDSWNQRLSELRDAGVIYEVKSRPCKITGRTVIEWDVNEFLPVKIVKPTEFKCPHCKGTGKIKQERLL